jgi:hypothetical protein
MLVTLGAEWWAEPIEQPADRSTLATYDVDADVLARWRAARNEYLAARACSSGRSSGRAGGRRRALQRPATSTSCSTVRPGADPPRFVEVEDQNGRSVSYGSGCSGKMATGC